MATPHPAAMLYGMNPVTSQRLPGAGELATTQAAFCTRSVVRVSMDGDAPRITQLKPPRMSAIDLRRSGLPEKKRATVLQPSPTADLLLLKKSVYWTDLETTFELALSLPELLYARTAK
jgi:hypothetical protein